MSDLSISEGIMDQFENLRAHGDEVAGVPQEEMSLDTKILSSIQYFMIRWKNFATWGM